MKDKYKHDPSQLFNFTMGSYLERTSRPIYAIVFLLPFIVFYELGVIFSNTKLLEGSAVLVVAFVWLQKFLLSLGFSNKLALAAPPLVVVVILVALQLTSQKKWSFQFRDIFPMTGECIVLAVPLIVLILFLSSSPELQNHPEHFDTSAELIGHRAVVKCSSVAEGSGEQDDRKSLLVNIIAGIGAGIYEELVFRLILICALMIVFQDFLRFDHNKSIILSVFISAALFSAHHHIDFLNGQLNPQDPFNLLRFCFRSLAGIYFAALFAIRGFGITAGTHAFYNIIAVSINAGFFEH